MPVSLNQTTFEEEVSSDLRLMFFAAVSIWAILNDLSRGHLKYLNGGLVRESPPNSLNSGLGTILICPDL